MTSKYGINDIVEMKKQHACGANRFKIIRMGADIRIKCEKCNRSIMIPRQTFNKKMKKIIVSQQDTESKENE
ncbi:MULTISPECIES: DUF951 domain-containing protein [Staphylococcus]|uniref:DUF951 domain-containing protein n=1 Tax=Staphylococcus lugdunensis TaxID=28035 RepID=A0ABD4EGN8_STALU|nr:MULTISPECIES: DUF951 domain-containing protein [Staphylococcus]ARB78691.1 DUF951 domain-containing protein [Staphylococcus lugdunensis]ARJ17496.1 DUF951 domain-containing protein [Staphylococcus lugdunensis]ARJ28320.1 DUF951 domain-containing protein [Staphylococcus lugdunensis]EFU83281.1 hypothetical protein HMPREF0790_2113 [Staphylococcus lugdunensis M23590]KXA38906.1 hypothetical protein HMPREF3225_01011 [Staphylococcus lugdunensis]